MKEPCMSDSTLLQQFLRLEVNATVRQLLQDALADPEPRKARREFEFNRFNVKLDFERQVAVIDDETDTSSAGSVEIELEQFARLIR
jgi:hypothetical protein